MEARINELIRMLERQDLHVGQLESELAELRELKGHVVSLERQTLEKEAMLRHVGREALTRDDLLTEQMMSLIRLKDEIEQQAERIRRQSAEIDNLRTIAARRLDAIQSQHAQIQSLSERVQMLQGPILKRCLRVWRFLRRECV